MQFQVPQFIESEDKIVGPLSLRQFAYIGAGGVLSAFLYFVGEPWLWIIGSLIIFGLAGAFAFVKIEGRPFANVVLSAFYFYWKPQTYVWQPEHQKLRTSEKKVAAEAGRSALEDILAKSAAHIKRVPSKHETPEAREITNGAPEIHEIVREKQAPMPQVAPESAPTISRAAVSSGSALHKSWEDVQTGAAFDKKNSDKQFLERKMAERYQIFQRLAGNRDAAKRVDYR